MMNKKLLNRGVSFALTLMMAFCFSMPANAQLGGLLKKAKGVVNGDAEKRVESVESNIILNNTTRENELGINKNGQTSSSKASNLNKIYEGTSWEEDKVIVTWNPDTKQFVLKKTFADGELAGQRIVYTYNAETGEIKRNDGQLMATIKDDDIIFPEIGTLSINTKTGGGLSLNGTSLGKVTRTEAYCYGKQFGHFRREVDRPLVAFFLFNEYAAKDEVAKLKSAMDARDKAAAEGMANFKANVKKLTAGKFLDNTGKLLGQITANGDVLNSANQRIGRYANGKITNAVSGANLGSIDDKGMVYDQTGSPKGRLQPNGAIDNKSGSNIGHIYPDGRIENRSSSTVVRFTGEGRYIAAALYMFFFNIK